MNGLKINIFINENKVNNMDEFNLLHDIPNTFKHSKNINSHYSPIMNGCMNTFRGKEKFKMSLVLLDIVYISDIGTRRLMKRLKTKEDDVMQWNKQ